MVEDVASQTISNILSTPEIDFDPDKMSPNQMKLAASSEIQKIMGAPDYDEKSNSFLRHIPGTDASRMMNRLQRNQEIEDLARDSDKYFKSKINGESISDKAAGIGASFKNALPWVVAAGVAHKMLISNPTRTLNAMKSLANTIKAKRQQSNEELLRPYYRPY